MTEPTEERGPLERLLGYVADRLADGTATADPVLSPDCRVGKHDACSGDALDEATDEIVPCQCFHHAKREGGMIWAVDEAHAAEMTPSGLDIIHRALIVTTDPAAPPPPRRQEWAVPGHCVDIDGGRWHDRGCCPSSHREPCCGPRLICPDGGVCHHECETVCYRVQACGPLSAARYPNDAWPAGIDPTPRVAP